MENLNGKVYLDGKELTHSQIRRDCMILTSDLFFQKYYPAMVSDENLAKFILKELRMKEQLMTTIESLPNSRGLFHKAANELSSQLKEVIPCNKVSIWLVEYMEKKGIFGNYLVPYAWTPNPDNPEDTRPEFELDKKHLGKPGCLILRDIVFRELYGKKKLDVEYHIINNWKEDPRVDHEAETNKWGRNNNGIVVVSKKEKDGNHAIFQLLNKYREEQNLSGGSEKVNCDFTVDDYLLALEYADLCALSYL